MLVRVEVRLLEEDPQLSVAEDPVENDLRAVAADEQERVALEDRETGWDPEDRAKRN